MIRLCDWLRRHYVAYRDQMERRYHARRLDPFANKHRGQRCFIIGNGPSLGRMDLSPLANEVTFGLNRIYLLFDKIGFPTTYVVSVNELVLEQCASTIQNLPTTKFVSWAGRRWLHASPDLFFIRSVHEPGFTPDVRRGVWEGSTVTYVAMQIAYYMGFRTVILIGVDHHFSTQGKPHAEVVSQGDDPNHFDPGYFGKGFRWHLPDLETSELAYRLARWQYENAGRVILDATVDGKLQVFPKVRFEEVMGVGG